MSRSRSIPSRDVFSLRISNRSGTNADDTKCKTAGTIHTSAVGLRLYYDSALYASSFDAAITPKPAVTYFLHSDGTACASPGLASFGITTRSLDDSAPAGADKCSESPSGNPGGANAWKEIGTWTLTLP